MKRNPCGFTAMVLVVIAALFAASTGETLAQDGAEPPDYVRPRIERPAYYVPVPVMPAVVHKDYTKKVKMQESNAGGWAAVEKFCQHHPPGATAGAYDPCAQAAIVEVTAECGADAQLFTKDTRKWQVAGFALVLASAAFTAVGASTSIANATIYSTLGGTTALGAVTTNANAIATSDQAGLAALNTVLTSFQTYVQTGGAGGNTPPTPILIYQSAPFYAARCGAYASASTASK